MSRARKAKSQPAAKNSRGPPYVGALLRMTYQMTRRPLLTALMERGFTDLNQAYLTVFQYPHPDGSRPTELADRAHMTKQAMNYLLGELETLGYIERRAEKGRNRRLVYLTRRGWEVVETQLVAMQHLEAQWATILGKKRFDEFLSALRKLSLLDSKGGAQSAALHSRDQIHNRSLKRSSDIG